MMTIGAQRRSGSCRKWDDEFGLDWNYFGARYYDPEIGRWLSVDPLVEKFSGWSPYNYTLDNPIKFFDPDGSAPRSVIRTGYAGVLFDKYLKVRNRVLSSKAKDLAEYKLLTIFLVQWMRL